MSLVTQNFDSFIVSLRNDIARVLQKWYMVCLDDQQSSSGTPSDVMWTCAFNRPITTLLIASTLMPAVTLAL